MGVAPSRLRLEWVSASEAQRWAEVVRTFTEHIRALGPLPAPVGGADLKEEVHA